MELFYVKGERMLKIALKSDGSYAEITTRYYKASFDLSIKDLEDIHKSLSIFLHNYYIDNK